jgi:hypothetical protein
MFTATISTVGLRLAIAIALAPELDRLYDLL